MLRFKLDKYLKLNILIILLFQMYNLCFAEKLIIESSGFLKNISSDFEKKLLYTVKSYL